MADCLVSVILSSYNRPEMLRLSLESVLNQTYKDLEILIQDDSTTEDCCKVVKSYADPRITYTRNIPSLGTSQNMKAGYVKSRGKYFCTLNDDDLFGADYVETMVQAMEADPACSMAFCACHVIDATGTIVDTVAEPRAAFWNYSSSHEGRIPDPLKDALIARGIPGVFTVFRTEQIDLNDFPVEIGTAYDFWLKYLALRSGAAAYYTPRKLTYYRGHEGMQTHFIEHDPRQRLRAVEANKYMLSRMAGDSRLSSIHDTVVARLARTAATEGFAWLRLGNRSRACKAFLASFQVKLNAAALAGLMLCGSPKAVYGRALKRK
jgi:glycosyltransferase involved in cell wall biosynthesis